MYLQTLKGCTVVPYTLWLLKYSHLHCNLHHRSLLSIRITASGSCGYEALRYLNYNLLDCSKSKHCLVIIILFLPE